MSTLKQIQANRRNAQLSTGPRTPDGKAISRMNALTSGIDAFNETACGENPAELAEVAANYDREYQPMGAVERLLVDLMIHNDWLLRRYRFLRADLTNHSAAAPFSQKEGNEYGAGFAANADAIHRLHRHACDAERAFFRQLEELEHRQYLRHQREAEAAAETKAAAEAKAAVEAQAAPETPVQPPVTDSPQTENPEIGFVPQITQNLPIPPAPQPAALFQPACQPGPSPFLPKIVDRK